MAATLQCKRSQLLVAATAEPICKLECYLALQAAYWICIVRMVLQALVLLKGMEETLLGLYTISCQLAKQ